MTDAARDNETIETSFGGQKLLLSWHSPHAMPGGTPHGATALCRMHDDRIVLVSQDGEHWDLPGGRPEENETPTETLCREVLEEACATVTSARLVGFSRGECTDGPELGLILVRSLWLAEVDIAPWNPKHETGHRTMVPPSEVTSLLRTTYPVGYIRVFSRMLEEADAHGYGESRGRSN